MREKNCTFNRAQYLTGEELRLRFPARLKDVQIRLYRLETEYSCRFSAEEWGAVIEPVSAGNYGIVVTGRLYGEAAGCIYTWEGAFDVVDSHRDTIRYGFLSDFSPGEEDVSDVAWMRDLHLNAVQFYDWMYRHDNLIAPSEDYEDPMGRKTSLKTISRKIGACKAFGMRPFAYGAVYAATENTFRLHPEWGMYTMDKTAMLFAGWLYYMNVSRECGWTEYLLNEYRKAVEFGFSGIHMDTYGFPKRVWDHEGKTVELAEAFPDLIDRAAEAVQNADRDGGVIFNAVNNWPTRTVASAAQDAVYIEVWPPNDTYFDLYTLIREARQESGKPVVLAAYMKPFLEEDKAAAQRALLLAWAAICASGGTQLVFGENRAALRDSYYANYACLEEKFLPAAQRYCDFLVRYGDLMYNDRGMDVSKTASGGINEDVCFAAENCGFSADGKAGTVWTILRESAGRLTIHLINLRGNDCEWNRPKNEPEAAKQIQIRLRLDRSLRGVYLASPDEESLCAVALSCACQSTPQGRIYTVNVPVLRRWAVVWAEVEE